MTRTEEPALVLFTDVRSLDYGTGGAAPQLAQREGGNYRGWRSWES